MCDEIDMQLKYFSLYSLDYNFIEKVFTKLKQWLKKNYILINMYENLKNFLNAILMQLNQKSDNHFHNYYISIWILFLIIFNDYTLKNYFAFLNFSYYKFKEIVA